MAIKVVDILGFRLIKNDLKDVPLNDKILINTISPNSYGLAIKDSNMDESLKNSDYLVLDGVYFGLAPLFLKGEKVTRITGWDCFTHFSEKMNISNGRVFFLGSTEQTLRKIKEKYAKEYSNVTVGYFSPPFKPEFEENDHQEMRNAINEFMPNVVFVGLTAPKQEKWGYYNKPFLKTNIICTIGNVFDWYAGNSKRPEKVWQKLGLEWFVRIFYRPEVFKRNIANQMLFFWHLLLLTVKLKKL